MDETDCVEAVAVLRQAPRIRVASVDVNEIVSTVFGLGPQVRYAAVASGQSVLLRERPALAGASSSESDRFEELLVNPTLLLLTRQRGDIDCGGLRYVVVRYGNFAQVIVPHPVAGHVSVALEPGHDPTPVAEAVAQLLGDPALTEFTGWADASEA